MDDNRSQLRRLVLEAIPRALALLDKNPYSKTFGSFDRKFWHYKIIDFSSGMQQELVVPLAYVWSTEFEGNPYYQCPRLMRYIQGIFEFHSKHCHPDGSLDDYFPHERALGATAYVLVALTEAALRTGLHSAADLKALERTGQFVAEFREAGKLSNHVAIAIAALCNLHKLTRNDHWRTRANALADFLLAEQHPEGWFPEYEGCDPGYLTVTIEFLARAVAGGLEHPGLSKALNSAVAFVRHFVHPDGSLGGEYGSRNTYNFYPGGFAILSADSRPAREILFSFFHGLTTGAANHLDDDGVFQHLLSSYVVTLSSASYEVSEWTHDAVPLPEIAVFEGARLFTIRTGDLAAYGALGKGGIYKVFRGNSLVASDTGYMVELEDGRIFCQNKSQNATGEVKANTVRITGHLKRYKSKTLSRAEMIGLRALSILFGRFATYSHWIRRLMQQVLIYDREPASISFSREIAVEPGVIHVDDVVTNRFPVPVKSIHRTTDAVNMHVVTSNSFQLANLLDWEPCLFEKGCDVFAYRKSYKTI